MFKLGVDPTVWGSRSYVAHAKVRRILATSLNKKNLMGLVLKGLSMRALSNLFLGVGPTNIQDTPGFGVIRTHTGV